MVEPNDAQNLVPELENRLDDLFDANATLLLDNEAGDGLEYYPLSELKHLILSIDWEITDEVLEKLLQQIKDLNMTYQHDKTVLTLLQILNSLGVYIKKKRAEAHPKTFKTLNSVFSSLDKVVVAKDMVEADRQKILNSEINRYKKLRIQIAESKAEKKKHEVERKEPGVTSSELLYQPTSTGESQEPIAEALVRAVEEIKQYVHAEIEALKAEIKSLLKK